MAGELDPRILQGFRDIQNSYTVPDTNLSPIAASLLSTPDTRGIDQARNPLLDPNTNLAKPNYDILDYVLSFLGGPTVAKDTRDRRVRQALAPVTEEYSAKINEAIRNNQFELADKYNTAFSRYAVYSPQAARMSQTFTDQLNKVKGNFQANTALLDSSMESLNTIPDSKYRQHVAGILDNLRRNAAVIPTEQLQKRIENLYPNVSTSKDLGTVSTSKTGEQLSQKPVRTFTTELHPLVANAALAKGDLNQNELINWYREAEAGDKKSKLALEALHKKYQPLVERGLVNQGLPVGQRGGATYEEARQEVLGIPQNTAQVSPSLPQNVPQGQPTPVPPASPVQPSSSVIQGQRNVQPVQGQGSQGFRPILVKLPDPLNPNLSQIVIVKNQAELEKARKLGGIEVGFADVASSGGGNQPQPQAEALQLNQPQISQIPPVRIPAFPPTGNILSDRNIQTGAIESGAKEAATLTAKRENDSYSVGSIIKLNKQGKPITERSLGNVSRDEAIKRGYFHFSESQDLIPIQRYNQLRGNLLDYIDLVKKTPASEIRSFGKILSSIAAYIPVLGPSVARSLLTPKQAEIFDAALAVVDLVDPVFTNNIDSTLVKVYKAGIIGAGADKTSMIDSAERMLYRAHKNTANLMNAKFPGSAEEPDKPKTDLYYDNEGKPHPKLKDQSLFQAVLNTLIYYQGLNASGKGISGITLVSPEEYKNIKPLTKAKDFDLIEFFKKLSTDSKNDYQKYLGSSPEEKAKRLANIQDNYRYTRENEAEPETEARQQISTKRYYEAVNEAKEYARKKDIKSLRQQVDPLDYRAAKKLQGFRD